MRRAGLRLRLVLGAAVISGLAAVALVVGVQVVLELTATRSVDTVLSDRADLVVSSLEEADDGLRVPDGILGPGVAVYADGTLVAGQVPPALAGEFADLARTGRATSRTVGDEYRLRAVPLRSPGGSPGVVVVSERTEPYEGDERAALVISLAAGLALITLGTGLAAWTTRRVLAPVARMARTAEEWSDRDLDRRFDLRGPGDELHALGRTLDGLLERVSRALRSEQLLTSELAHELRTPLTAVAATAEVVALRRDLDDDLRRDLDEILRGCRAMAASITALLELARLGTGSSRGEARTSAVVDATLEQVDAGHRVEVDVGEDDVVLAPAELAARALAPLVDNALRVAAHVRIRAHRREGWVHVEVVDDGPGLALHADEVFAPGVRRGDGTGLGLPLARRVARTLGGDVVVGPRPDDGGACFVLVLPVGRT